MDEAHEELDSEQFGMRHRSAIKLCLQCDDIIVFVVSQDGGISLIWNKERKVYLKSDIKTTNLNMILS
jgi:DNA integrity scanning protein DisA with diadenylate cyclase activity